MLGLSEYRSPRGGNNKITKCYCLLLWDSILNLDNQFITIHHNATHALKFLYGDGVNDEKRYIHLTLVQYTRVIPKNPSIENYFISI